MIETGDKEFREFAKLIENKLTESGLDKTADTMSGIMYNSNGPCNGMGKECYVILQQLFDTKKDKPYWALCKAYNDVKPKTLVRAKRKMRELTNNYRLGGYKLEKQWEIVPQQENNEEEKIQEEILTRVGRLSRSRSGPDEDGTEDLKYLLGMGHRGVIFTPHKEYLEQYLGKWDGQDEAPTESGSDIEVQHSGIEPVPHAYGSSVEPGTDFRGVDE